MENVIIKSVGKNLTKNKMKDKETIKIEDDRYYVVGEEFYPSVTTILASYPKGHHLMKWVGEHGMLESKRLKETAAAKGSLVHQVVEGLIDGEEVQFKNFEEDEWRYLMAFKRFWEEYQPKTVETEHQIQSDNHKYAGTLDWSGTVKEKDKEIFIRVDWKTSNFLYAEYDLQLVAYEMAEREAGKKEADELWVVQLGTKTKKGYSLHKVKDFKEKFEAFKHVQWIWDYTHPNAKPRCKEYPVKIKL